MEIHTTLILLRRQTMSKSHNRKQKKELRSVIITWLISYVLIFLVPIFSFMFLFSYTNSFVVREINESNEVLLSNIQNNIDGILETLDIASTSNIFNKHFEKLFNLKSDSSEFRYELLSSVDRLYVNYQANPIVDIIVYLPQEQYLISSKTANHISYIYGSLNIQENSIAEDEWIDLLDNTYRDSYFISSHISYRNYGRESIVFARSYPLAAKTKIQANIFVSIPYSHIQSISDVSSGTFLILDEGGRALLFDDISLSEEITLMNNKGTKSIHIDGKPYVLSYVKSNQTDWYYSVLISENDFWEKANYIRIITLVCMFIALILGFVSIYLLLKRNYKPVRNVINLISNGEHNPTKNEFALIKEAYTRLNKENSTMKNNLTKQREHSRGLYLLSRLKNINGHLVDEDSMEYFQLDFDDKYFAMVSFCRRYTEEDIRFFDNDYMTYSNFISFVIDNVFSELNNNKYQYFQINDDENILYLFVLEQGKIPDWEKECKIKIDQLYQFLKQKLDLPFYITIGDLCNDFNNINAYYDDLMKASEYNCIIHDDGIVLVKDVVEPNSHKGKSKNNYEKILNNALTLSNYRKASSITNVIFDEFFEDDASTFPMAKFYIYHLIDRILNFAVSEVDFDISKKSFQALLDNVTLCTSTHTLKKAFLNILKAICGISQEKYDEKMQSLVNKIKIYVNNNYMDCNLNIASIADAMELNPKYMSRLFKEENGEGLLDYINTVRIQKAKLIIASQELTFEDLALMVGYTNVRTFRRAFLKIEGTTPSKYKKTEK